MAEPNIFEEADRQPTPGLSNIFGDLESTRFEGLDDERRSYFGAAFKSGLQQAGATVTSIGASLGFTPSRRQLLDIYRDDPEGFKLALSKWGQSADEQQRAAAATLDPKGLTPAGQRAAAQSYFPTGGQEFVGFERVAGDIAGSVPFLAPPMGAAVVGGLVAGPAGAAAAGAVTGAALEGFSQLLQVRQELDKYPLTAWEKVPRFQELIKSGYRPETARLAVIEETASEAGIVTGASAATLDAISGGVLGAMVARRVAGRGTRALGLGAVEGLTEAGQSAQQQVGQNLALRGTVEPGKNIFEDVPAAAIGGAVTGAALGGGVGALTPGPRAEGEDTTTSPTAPPAGSRDWNIGNLIDGKGGFQLAPSPEAGVAMAIRNVQSYPAKFNKGAPMTLRQVAHRWAPADDGKTPLLRGNNPDNWAKVVADSMGISPDDVLDTTDPTVMAAFAKGVHTIEHGRGKLFPQDVYEKGAEVAFSGQPVASVPEDPLLVSARRRAAMAMPDDKLDAMADAEVDEVLASYGEQEVLSGEKVGDVPETVAALGETPPATVAPPDAPSTQAEGESAPAPTGVVPSGRVPKTPPKDVPPAQQAPATSLTPEQAEQLNQLWQAVTRKEKVPEGPTATVLGHYFEGTKGALPLEPAHLARLASEAETVAQFTLDEAERAAALRRVADNFAKERLGAAVPQGRAAFGRSDEANETLLATPNPNNSLALGNLPVSHSERANQIGKPLRQTALRPGEVVGVGVPTQHFPAAFFADAVQTVRDLVLPYAPRARIVVSPVTRAGNATQSFMRRLDPKVGIYLINPRNATRIDEVPPGQYNSTTRSQIMYGLAHEGGHVIMEESFLEGLDPKVAEQLRTVGQTDPFELVPEEVIAQLDLDRAAILREFNAIKQQYLGPSSKATFGDWLTRVASPQVLVQGVGQPLKQMTLKHWANMYFGQGTWDVPARAGVLMWYAKGWPAASLHEYMADQFARYAENKGLLRNTALGQSTWFKDLWAKLRQYWNDLRAAGLIKKRLGAEKAFEAWVKALAAKPANPRRGRALRVPTEAPGEVRNEAGRVTIVDPEPNIFESTPPGWDSAPGRALPSQDEASRMLVEALQNLSRQDSAQMFLKDALTQIIPHINDPGYRALANHLVGITPSTIPIRPLYEGGAQYTTGRLPEAVWLPPEQDPNVSHVEYILHETIHALTVISYREERAAGTETANAFDDLFYFLRPLMMESQQYWVRYATRNPMELLAVAFTRPEVQNFLAQVDIPPEIANRLTLNRPKGPPRNAWQAFVQWVGYLLKIPVQSFTALEATLEAGRRFMARNEARRDQFFVHKNKLFDILLDTQHNMLPEADSVEASEAAIITRGLNLPADAEGEALEMLSRGQVEAAKELVEQTLASPNLIRWSAPPPTGLQVHVSAIAKAMPGPWESLKTWYGSGLRKFAEVLSNFVNIREYAFSDPANRGAAWIARVMTDYKAYMNLLEGRSTRTAQSVVKMGAKQQRRMFDLMRKEWNEGAHWTQLRFVPGQGWRHEPTQKLLNEAHQAGLKEDGIATLVAMKNDYLFRLQELHRILFADLDGKKSAALARGAKNQAIYYDKLITNLAKEIRRVREAPFLPMTRFGEYVLEVRDQGQVIHVEAYESPELRARARRRLEASPQAIGLTITELKPQDSTSAVLSVLPLNVLGHTSAAFGLTPRQLANLRSRLDYITANPRTRKYSLDLGRITGHARDQLRAYADFMHHDALVLSKMLYREDFRQGLRYVAEDIAVANAQGNSERVARLEHSYSYLSKATQQILNPAQEYHFIRSLVVLKQLGFNIKTAVVNLSTLVNTWAVVTTRLGMAQGTTVMAKAMNDLAIDAITKASQKAMGRVTQGAQTLTPDERRAVAQAKQDGLIAETYAADMAFLASGSGVWLDRFNLPRTVGLQEGMAKWFRSTMRASLLPLRFVEETVRQTTFLTMFRAYTRQGLGFAEAYQAAKVDTEITQGDNTIQARAPVLRGKVPSIALIYFNFVRNMMFQLSGGYSRGRRRAEALGLRPPSKGIINETFKMWMAYLALGGLMGLPFAEDLDKVAQFVAERLFGKRFSPKEHAYEFAGWLAQNAAEVGIDLTPRSIVHGSMADFAGFDLSPSLSFGRVIPGASSVDRLGQDGEKFLLDLLGPFGRVVREALDLFNPALPPERQFSFFIPTAGMNLIRGVEPEPRFFDGSRIAVDPQTGQVRELSSGEMIGQLMGFTPEVVSTNQEIHWMQADTRAFWTERRNLLMKALWEAKLGGEPDALHDAMAEIRRFNDEAPRGLAITADSVRQSLLARQKRVLRQESGMSPERRLEPEFGRVRRLVIEGS